MKNKLFYDELSVIFKGLALLLHSGINLNDGVYVLADDEKGKRKDLLLDIGKYMDEGMYLYQALEKTECFPAYATGMVQVGEKTGRLEESLTALSSYYEERDRMDNKLKNALTYPSVLMLLMLVVIAVLLIKVLPVFDEVYASLGGSLTGVAGGMLKAGAVLESIMPFLCAVLFVFVIFLLGYVSSDSFRYKCIAVWNRKFGDNGVSRKMNNAHFAQALAMGLKSGLTMEESVDLSAELLKDIPAAAKRYGRCAELLNSGSGLLEALHSTDAMPSSSCRMLELGMRSGNGDDVMGEIADRLSEEAYQAMEEKTAKIEPAIVLAATLLVGIILLSVMLPLMNIMSAIG